LSLQIEPRIEDLVGTKSESTLTLKDYRLVKKSTTLRESKSSTRFSFELQVSVSLEDIITEKGNKWRINYDQSVCS
jgi:hypothetical protein